MNSPEHIWDSTDDIESTGNMKSGHTVYILLIHINIPRYTYMDTWTPDIQYTFFSFTSIYLDIHEYINPPLSYTFFSFTPIYLDVHRNMYTRIQE